jgi:hypothetical protein
VATAVFGATAAVVFFAVALTVVFFSAEGAFSAVAVVFLAAVDFATVFFSAVAVVLLF